MLVHWKIESSARREIDTIFIDGLLLFLSRQKQLHVYLIILIICFVHYVGIYE